MLCATIPVLAQTDYCGLRVHVTSAEGLPIDTQVTILDYESGTVLATVPTARGVAEYCDTGFRALSIRVPSCLAAENKAVGMNWGAIIDVAITFNGPVCRVSYPITVDYPPLAGCRYLLRVRDGKGSPVLGAHLRGGDLVRSDRFGRLYHFLRANTQEEVSIEATGMEANTVKLDCSVYVFGKEIPITLTRP